MDIKLALKEYGLSEKEIEVYLVLLSLGNTRLQELNKRLDFPRTTIYNTLDYLSDKGLVSKILIKGVTFYKPTEPQKLLEHLKQKEDLLKGVMDNLKSLQNTVKSSNAEIYQGQKGLFTILSDVYQKKQQLYQFGTYSKSLEILKHQPEHFRTIRLKRKIPVKVIIEKYDEPQFKDPEYKKYTEISFLAEMKDFPAMVFVYGEKVAIFTVENDLVGVIIENKEISIAFKIIFELLWKISKN